MQKIENFEEVKEAGEFLELAAGPQVCVIKNVVNNVDKEYLMVEVDIVEGEFKDFYTKLSDQFPGGRWGGSMCSSYKEKAKSFFKRFITSVVISNPGFKWEWDEQTLVGKKVVVNFRVEEYIGAKEPHVGERRAIVKPYEFRSLEALKAGEIKIPAPYTLEKQGKADLVVNSTPDNNETNITEAEDEALPF